MAITMGMVVKDNQDASSTKRLKTNVDDDDDGDSSSWSYLVHDILISVISWLGVIDFVSFSCVCKSWRTVAISHRNMFMRCREPMYIRFSTEVAEKKECYLEELEGRKFKTFFPNIPGDSICLGLVSGYLIFFQRKTHDFKLVNPITRHELHFPRYKFSKVPAPKSFRCTLVFSPTMSTWVFVFSNTNSTIVSLCFSSEGAKWTHLLPGFYIIDLHFFQGKIYALNLDMNHIFRLCEVRLGPTPSLTPLEMKNHLKVSEVTCPEFATWGEKLYMVGHHAYLKNALYVPYETDFDQMRWVKRRRALKEHACFVTEMSPSITKLELWMDHRKQYERFGFLRGTAKKENEGIRYTKDMWYFPHKCLDVNLLRE